MAPAMGSVPRSPHPGPPSQLLASGTVTIYSDRGIFRKASVLLSVLPEGPGLWRPEG